MFEVGGLKLNKYNPSAFSFYQYLIILIAGLVSMFILNISIGMTGTPIIFIILGLSTLFITLIIYNPKLWIYSVVLVSGVFSSTTGGGVSAIDIVFSIYLNIFLYLWIIWQIFIKKEKLINTKTEWFFFSFFILTTLTLINVLYELGTLYLNQGLRSEAAKAFETALQRLPEIQEQPNFEDWNLRLRKCLQEVR